MIVTVPATDIPQQYRQFKDEFDTAISAVLESGQFIGGAAVSVFEKQLAEYLHIGHVISCANGTDALELALMALGLPRGSKIIVPAFTYIAPVEVIQLMGYEPVYCDIDAAAFNCTEQTIAAVYTKNVKAILPVHLFGQRCDMKTIADFAEKNNCLLIEDNAQSIAAEKDLSNSTSILTTSFFPTKNLGCFGDGGAVLTNDKNLSTRIRQLSNHGQAAGKKYLHETAGINSRLDALQAAVLQVKLLHLDTFVATRRKVAAYYDRALEGIAGVQLPKNNGQHTYHQYTIRVEEHHRDSLQEYLSQKNIPTAIYYPLAAYQQQAYLNKSCSLPVTEKLCKTVLTLPLHTALDEPALSYICETIHSYFKK